MSNQRGTFAKRRREQELQERARAKQERRNARKSEPRTSKGPEIAWDEAVNPTVPSDDVLPIAGGQDGTPDPDQDQDTAPRAEYAARLTAVQ
ncbi:MAG: hypothetical protein AB7O24_00075 [Kofleriaceae bacterium]